MRFSRKWLKIFDRKMFRYQPFSKNIYSEDELIKFQLGGQLRPDDTQNYHTVINDGHYDLLQLQR